MNTFRISHSKEILLNEESQTPKRIQILRVGKFSHDEYGKFEVTKETLLSFVQNFKDKVRGVDIALDYAHDNQREAAAWFEDLMLSDDGLELWAEVKWTPKGAEKVSQKEYRYISADFAFDYKDAESGKKYGPVLFGAGLTNRPFVKNMAPAVELTEQTRKEILKMEEELKKEIEVLKAKIAELQAGKELADEDKVELMKDKKELSEKVEASEKALALSEKESSFVKLLSEGKLVPAQKEAFLSGDLMALLNAAKPLNLAEKGTTVVEEVVASTKDVEDQILEKAMALLSDKKVSDIQSGIKIVLSENAELAKEYQKKFAE